MRRLRQLKIIRKTFLIQEYFKFQRSEKMSTHFVLYQCKNALRFQITSSILITENTQITSIKNNQKNFLYISRIFQVLATREMSINFVVCQCPTHCDIKKTSFIFITENAFKMSTENAGKREKTFIMYSINIISPHGLNVEELIQFNLV